MIKRIFILTSFILLVPCFLFCQEISLVCNLPTVSNFKYTQVNNLLYFNFHQCYDTIPGYYVLEKTKGTEKKVVKLLEVTNAPIKKRLLVCMEDQYENNFNTYILKKINIPKELLQEKQYIQPVSILDTVYFIKVIKD